MGKIVRNIPSTPENDTFDWSLYEDGYNGTNFVPNTKVKTKGGIKVYSHEHYAQELFYKYFPQYAEGADIQAVKDDVPVAKDLIPGAVMRVVNVHPLGKTSIVLDTEGGGSCVVDLNKEKELVKLYQAQNASDLVEALKAEEFRIDFMTQAPVIKVIDKTRVSLWDGHIESIKREFDSQLRHATSAYYAHVLESNNGGYIVEVNGLHCFMPGSMAAAGILEDFNALIGTTVPVMIVGNVPGKGYIVSYKKYLSTIMPSKVREELTVNQKVIAKVTGLSKNGIFVKFCDKNGDDVFSGLIHRDEMSCYFEEMFNGGLFANGDTFPAFIHRVEVDGEKVRIVLGDKEWEEKKEEEQQ